jgi:F0F1-type ATP synthase delta subunit
VELKLPNNVVSQVDVARVLREINSLNDFFAGAAKRQSGTPMQLPKLTRLLDQVASDNGMNLLDEKDRKTLAGHLNLVLGKAPLLHISFAAEPSPKSLERILVWFRTNIHPQALLQVGLQPTIAAGCVLRTPNKFFDMSLRSYLKDQEPYLVQLINGAANRNG